MEKYIEIEGVKLHYDETGPAETPEVILMHGWGCNLQTVRSIAALLEPNYHVYNVDLPGHGKSQEPPSVWGIADFTRIIGKFAVELGMDRPALIGHSFGGRIAILMASHGNVGKVVLVDAAGIKPKRSLNYYRKVYTFKLLKKMLLAIYGKEKGMAKVEALRGKKGSADYRNSSPVMRAVMSRCVNEDLKFAMPLIKSPVLLIWGADDTATPLSDAKTMEKLIPDAGLVAFEGCGHYSFLDNPMGFKAVIRSFFNI